MKRRCYRNAVLISSRRKYIKCKRTCLEVRKQHGKICLALSALEKMKDSSVGPE